eukprot:CAMPEP_0168433556 /NCGR_PEP_ID=MMETSP0228-20121227/39458_1 /TAXON_ID=133427 /ORGANISM="Protoceratium reticulatum, Strain CCCM 535 (=CCMP 1889)" /LENGTH=171 /DNA_ID=CAMNT_0008447699 /DNA_START=156 /DNA_END=672 /DNA_ORIENTATION=+
MAPGASGWFFRALFASHGILSALVFILLIQEDDMDQLPLLRQIPKYLVTLQKPIECRLPCLRSKTILRLLSFYFSVGAWTRISTSTIPHYWFSIFLLGIPVHFINLLLFCCFCTWGDKEATPEKKDKEGSKAGSSDAWPGTFASDCGREAVAPADLTASNGGSAEAESATV